MGNALSLDGDGDRVDVSDVHDFTGTSQYTIETKVNPAALAAVYMVQKFASPDDGWAFSLSDTGQVRSFRRAESTTVNATSTATLSTSTWSHAATTYDGSTVRVYVNATLDGSVASALSMGDTTVDLAIGGSAAFGGHLNGLLDEVRIWDHARTQQEIADNMDREVDPNSPGLIGYYKFDESAGAVLDSSSTGANGTLIGDATRVTSTAGLTLIASAAGTSTSTGTSAAELIRSASASGASTSTGTASALVLRQASGSGASTSTGTAAALISYQATASGASVSAGQAAALAQRQATATGASMSTGQADATVDRQASAAGASTSTGAASATITQAETLQATASGSGVSAGSATATLHLAAVATGSLQSAGSAKALRQLLASASGSSTSTGSAFASEVQIPGLVTVSVTATNTTVIEQSAGVSLSTEAVGNVVVSKT